MFPLGLVLMPNMPLDLRIFEERYLKLLGDLVLQDEPEFGVVPIQRGRDSGGSERRYNFGTVAAVTDIGTTEEFYGLQSVGAQRFKVQAWLPDDPYPLADIEFIEDLVWDSSLDPLLETVDTSVRKLLAFASEFTDLTYGADIDLSDEPMELAWQLAGILPVGVLDQLELLASPTATDLLSNTLSIVESANESLLAMISEQGENDETGLTE